MSFYRTFIVAVAALGLATTVFAAETTTTTTDVKTTQAQTTETTKLDINKSTAQELMKVKGLTASKAKAIVSYRKKHGDFKSLDQLKEVKGFKRMKEENIKEVQEQLTVG